MSWSGGPDGSARIIQYHQVMTLCKVILIQPLEVELPEYFVMLVAVWYDFDLHFSMQV
jgi:hypothetical protein